MKFDYIILGAGSAGCVLANRLSENPLNNVLLIEAGYKDSHPIINIPAAFSELFKTKYDWNYETVPQASLNNQCMYQPRGKMLGGCSSMNAMIWLRPHISDLDTWGVKGWDWNSCLSYFLKTEKQMGFLHDSTNEAFSNEKYYTHTLSKYFLQSAERSGIKTSVGSSSVQNSAFSFLKNIRNGKRYSASDAYLKPIGNRKNLHILTNALVDKIIFKNENAISVQLIHNNELKQFDIKKELIISSGSFQSPAILQRSGVGDTSYLNELKINTVFDNPQVGLNLQDHLTCGFAFRIDPFKSLDKLNYLFPKLLELSKFVLGHRSALSSNIAEAGAFIFDSKNEPLLQFHFGPLFFIKHGFYRPKGYGFSLGPTLIRPRSSGFVKIHSSNPSAKLIINPCYYSNEQDLDLMIIGLERTLQMVNQNPLHEIIKHIELPLTIPQSKEDFVKHLREYSQTLYHPVGTCQMANSNGVVTNELKLVGFQNIRVADASIIPKITSSNTQAVTMMIAEKASDIILNS